MCGLHTLMVFISSRIHGMLDRPCLRVSLLIVSDVYIYPMYDTTAEDQCSSVCDAST